MDQHMLREDEKKTKEKAQERDHRKNLFVRKDAKYSHVFALLTK